MTAANHRCGSVLVTGAAGYVGSHLAEYLCTEWPQARILTVDRAPGRNAVLDLLDVDAVRECLVQHGVDTIVHLAGTVGSGSAVEQVGSNVLPALSILEACRQRSVRVLLVGSGSQYGRSQQDALCEDSAMVPVSLYGLTKLWQEMAGRFFHRIHGVDVVMIRISNIFGGDQAERYLPGKIVGRCRRAVAAGQNEVEDSGQDSVRDFIHIDDVCGAMLAIVERADSGSILNVGSGRGVHVQAVVQAAAKAFGLTLRYPSVPVCENEGIPYQALDISALSQIFEPTKSDVIAYVAQQAACSAV